MPKLTQMGRQELKAIVFENLTNGQRVKANGTHLELNTDGIQKYKPVCLLTTDVWGRDKLPADVRVVENRIVAAPKGYDTAKAFYFRGNAYYPVMEARIDRTKMNANTRGLTFKLHRAGSDYTRKEYVCVPKHKDQTDACLGTYSNDRGGVAVTKKQYDTLAVRNECRIALLMLKGVDKERDYEPVPIGAVLYAHNIKAGGDIAGARYCNRPAWTREVCTTFGWSPPVHARKESDFATESLQGGPEPAAEDMSESCCIGDIMKSAQQRIGKIIQSKDATLRSQWAREREKLQARLKESKQQWDQEREGLQKSLEESEQEAGLWRQESERFHTSLIEKGEEIDKLKLDVTSHKRKYDELMSTFEERQRAKNEGLQAELQNQLEQKNTELMQKEADIAKSNKRVEYLKSLYQEEIKKYNTLLNEHF